MHVRAAVIGGGVGGLATGYALAKAGWLVDVYEKQPWLGGLAARCEVGDLTLDRYYHFVCGGDADLVSLCRELELPIHWSTTGTSFYYEGRLYPFGSARHLLRFDALSWGDRYRLAKMMLNSYRDRDWSDLDRISAEEWLVKQIGERAYRVIWHPLLRDKFAERYHEISAAWIWHRIHRLLTSRRNPLARERLGYVEGGAGELIARLAARIGAAQGNVYASTPVTGLSREADGAICVESPRGAARYDVVVAALPGPSACEILGESAPPELRQVEYIGVTCLLLVLDHPLNESFWVNINDSRIGFGGFIEYTNLNPRAAKGKHVVYVPYYGDPGGARFSLSDEALLDEYVASLRLIAPSLRREEIVAWRVFRDLYAQPICTNGFAERAPPFRGEWPNLFFLESSQLYPADRNLSGMLELAGRVVKLVGE
jgi:protoporphyrinogen oxidase